MRLLNVTTVIFTLATLASADNLLLLPVAGGTDNPADMATIDRLYRDAVETSFKGNLLPASNAGEACPDRACLAASAKQAGADQVIYSTFSRLGSKWVFSSTIMNSDGGGAFNQSLTVSSVEDMPAATQKMAADILGHALPEETTNADTKIETTETKYPQTAHTLSASGLALGYMWPLGDSYGSLQGNPPAIIQPHSQIVRLSWLTAWELPNNLLLNADIVWGFIDASLGADANLNYVFNQTDFSPFLGGGLGLHYVFDNYVVSDSRQSGPAANVQGGLLLFRNSDVHVMLRGEYQMIFNTDVEKIAIFDIGITVRKLDFWH